MGSFVVLFTIRGSGESRENRLQLRCGIASNPDSHHAADAWAKPIGRFGGR
jgi:hypothetical protein